MEKGNTKRKARGGRKKKVDIGNKRSLSAADQEVASVSTESKEKEVAESVPNESTDAEKKDDGKTSDPEIQGRSDAGSPEPNCAICLGKLENKSFTDSCFHMFCFVCLVEWSKVKAECPLCKQSFKSIVHNVRSYEDYDQYHIQRPDLAARLPPAIPGAFRYRTTMADHGYIRTENIDSLEWHLRQRVENEMLQRPSHRQYRTTNWRRLRQAASSEFRTTIYRQHLKAKDTSSRRRYREVNPDFFRTNPACSHRLVPWLNRELLAVVHGCGERTAFVLELILGLIKRYDIKSEEFYTHLYPFLGEYTRHFMHEFYMFARSPFQMSGYDRNITYEPMSDNEDDSDDVIFVNSTRPPVPRPSSPPTFPFESILPTDRSPLENMLSVDLSLGWDSPTAGPSWNDLFQNTPLDLRYGSTSHQDSNSQQPQNIVSSDEEPSSGNESDVIFVDYEKPWTDRSPIQLSSSSDVDVSVASSSTLKKKSKKKRKREHSEDRLHTKRHKHTKSRLRTRSGSHSRNRTRSSSPSHSRSRLRERSQTRSPIIMRLNAKDYWHKKFSYSRKKDNDSRHSRLRHRHRSHSTDSEDCARWSTLGLSKHSTRSRSRSSSIDVVRHKHSSSKRSKKHKKHSHKKHKKTKRRHRSASSNAKTFTQDVEKEIAQTNQSKNDETELDNRLTKASVDIDVTYEGESSKSAEAFSVNHPGPSKCSSSDNKDSDSIEEEVYGLPSPWPSSSLKAEQGYSNIHDFSSDNESSVKRFKKHPSGHKKSKKTSEENSSPTTQGVVHNSSVSAADTSVIVSYCPIPSSPQKTCFPGQTDRTDTVQSDSVCVEEIQESDSDSDINITGFSDKVDNIARSIDLTDNGDGTAEESSSDSKLLDVVTVQEDNPLDPHYISSDDSDDNEFNFNLQNDEFLLDTVQKIESSSIPPVMPSNIDTPSFLSPNNGNMDIPLQSSSCSFSKAIPIFLTASSIQTDKVENCHNSCVEPNSESSPDQRDIYNEIQRASSPTTEGQENSAPEQIADVTSTRKSRSLVLHKTREGWMTDDLHAMSAKGGTDVDITESESNTENEGKHERTDESMDDVDDSFLQSEEGNECSNPSSVASESNFGEERISTMCAAPTIQSFQSSNQSISCANTKSSIPAYQLSTEVTSVNPLHLSVVNTNQRNSFTEIPHYYTKRQNSSVLDNQVTFTAKHNLNDQGEQIKDLNKVISNENDSLDKSYEEQFESSNQSFELDDYQSPVVSAEVQKGLNQSSGQDSIPLIPGCDSLSLMTPTRDPLYLQGEKDSSFVDPVSQYYTKQSRSSLIMSAADSSILSYSSVKPQGNDTKQGGTSSSVCQQLNSCLSKEQASSDSDNVADCEDLIGSIGPDESGTESSPYSESETDLLLSSAVSHDDDEEDEH